MTITQVQDCHLNGTFSCVVQFFLAFFAFSSLIYKYSVEIPQRPFRTFQLDAGKMAIGGGTSHVLNLIFSQAWADDEVNPCVWFFIGVILDSTAGVFLCYLLLEVAEYQGSKRGIHVRGSYGDPISYERWGVQCFFWTLIVILAKVITTVIIYTDASWFMQVGNAMLSPWQKMPRVELVIAVLITPFLCNVFAFWVTDSFLKGLVEKTVGYSKLAFDDGDEELDVDEHSILNPAAPDSAL